MDESEHAFEARLCRVIAQAEAAFLEEPYRWQSLAGGEAPRDDAIACVKDGAAWHQFVPAVEGDDAEGGFTVVRFRFAEDGPSAIGFVAWLHSHLRIEGKTGAIVICGKDARESAKLFEICQGAMDYWACPLGPAGDRFLTVIRTLIERGQSL